MAPWVYTVSAQKMLAAAVAVLSEIDCLSFMAFGVFRRNSPGMYVMCLG